MSAPPAAATLTGRPSARLAAAVLALPVAIFGSWPPSAGAAAPPSIEPLETRAYLDSAGTFPLPFHLFNPSERQATCLILFNFREMPVWKGAARVDPGERLAHTAQVEARHFVFDRHSVRARLAAVVEMDDEAYTRPIEVVFAPLLPLQPQCRYRIRGQHRIDGPPQRSDLLAEVSLVPEGASLRCRLLAASAPNPTWEILYQPLPPQGSIPEAARLLVRPGPSGAPAVESAAGRLPDVRVESPLEGGEGRVLDLVFPPGSSEAVAIQTILWTQEGAEKQAHCPFAATLDQARDPAYAPELVPRPLAVTHRVWVRAAPP